MDVSKLMENILYALQINEEINIISLKPIFRDVFIDKHFCHNMLNLNLLYQEISKRPDLKQIFEILSANSAKSSKYKMFPDSKQLRVFHKACYITIDELIQTNIAYQAKVEAALKMKEIQKLAKKIQERKESRDSRESRESREEYKRKYFERENQRILLGHAKMKARENGILGDPQVKFKFNCLKPEEKKVALNAIKYFDLIDLSDLNRMYKLKALENHPDKGGDTEEFKRIVNYKDILLKII